MNHTLSIIHTICLTTAILCLLALTTYGQDPDPIVTRVYRIPTNSVSLPQYQYHWNPNTGFYGPVLMHPPSLHSSTRSIPNPPISNTDRVLLHHHSTILLKIKAVLDEHKLLTSGSTEDIFETVRRLAKASSMK
jgi:hypothetical protein